MKRYLFATLILCAGAVSGCRERITTAPDLGFLQVDPLTVEVLIPFEDFVDGVQVFDGFGSAADVGRAFIARDFNGLDSRTRTKNQSRKQVSLQTNSFIIRSSRSWASAS